MGARMEVLVVREQQQPAAMASPVTHPDEIIVAAHRVSKIYRAHGIEAPALADVSLTIGAG